MKKQTTLLRWVTVLVAGVVPVFLHAEANKHRTVVVISLDGFPAYALDDPQFQTQDSSQRAPAEGRVIERRARLAERGRLGDATGNADAMGSSLSRVAPAGRMVFVGLSRDPVSIDDALFHNREVTLYANRNSSNQFSRITLIKGLVELDTSDT